MSWLSGFLKGGSTTQTKDPWKPAVAPLKDSLNTAQSLYANRPALYTGRFTAPNDPSSYTGASWLEDQANSLKATNPGQSTINLANKYSTDALNYKVPTFADYDTSAINPVIKALTDPVFQNYQNNVVPQMLAGQDRSGATHNTRTQLDNYNTSDAFAREAGNIAATTGYQDFSDWRSLLNSNNQQNSAQIPSLYSSGYAQQALPSQLMTAAGSARQGLAQNDINNSLQQDQYNRTTPWSDFMNLFNTLSTAGQLGGTTKTQENSNPLTQLMKLLGPIAGTAFQGGGSTPGTMTGATGSSGGAVAGANGSVGDIGSAISAIAMSSPLFKTNIEMLSGAEALDAIIANPAFSYNYLEGYGDSGEKRRYGPMADKWSESFGGDGKGIPMPQMLGLMYAVVRELALREAKRGNS